MNPEQQHEQFLRDGRAHADWTRWTRWAMANAQGGVIPPAVMGAIFRNSYELDDGE